MERPIKFFAGNNTKSLAGKIANAFGAKLNKSSIIEFSDGEFEPSFDETVRGADVFLIQSTTPPSDNLMELLLMIDAAKRASAANIIAVMPYFGYARQDKKGKPRVPIGAKLVANLLSAAGVDRIMTMDLHADQIQGFFEVPVDHLYASELFIEDITNLNLPNLIIASPDMGGSKRANAYAKILNSGVVVCYKERKQANVIGEMKILGDVNGKDVVIIDDMVDTGGTLTKAADLMMESGATSVRAYCTHGILSGAAYERLDNSSIAELIITNTIPKTHNSSKVREISVADFFAQTITSVVKNESISDKWKSNQ
ncbi:MAG: ribose-phosphate pyrophosphokinase [Flavobacteriales bacterium]|nr:ribose-phosphate pyrophosphokinase [Flavobacteriales bacterium]MBT5090207.1 ribose-phosphate pyrophosphokinase [Flavobacteriales bacterium]MBT5750666.1 ribose-phosphate pyrophosphokinase [Flavobacteriales bacterium]